MSSIPRAGTDSFPRGEWSVGDVAVEKERQWEANGVSQTKSKSFSDYVAEFFAWLGSFFCCGSKSDVGIRNPTYRQTPPVGANPVRGAVGQGSRPVAGRTSTAAAATQAARPAARRKSPAAAAHPAVGRKSTAATPTTTPATRPAVRRKSPAAAAHPVSHTTNTPEARAQSYIQQIDQLLPSLRANGTTNEAHGAQKLLGECEQIATSVTNPALQKRLNVQIRVLRSTIQSITQN